MNKQSCEMSVEFDTKSIIKAISENCRIEFLTDNSTPSSANEAFQCTHHILKCVARQLEKCSEDGKYLAIFASELGFGKFIDKEKEIQNILKDPEISQDIIDTFTRILGYVTKN